MKKLLKNPAASVRARLTNLARNRGADFLQILTQYGIERFLYRLSTSVHQKNFILKGAMLYVVWENMPTRATRDLDLLGFGDTSKENVRKVIGEICKVPCDDGITFDETSINLADIRGEDEYLGTRAIFQAELSGAKIQIQIDIGVGDFITPEEKQVTFPSLLSEMPTANLRAYTPESVIAEKFHAIVTLGMLNTRLKDYFDLHFISKHFDFELEALAAAISGTFERRKTDLPRTAPVGLTLEFASDVKKRTQWSAFCQRIGQEIDHNDLSIIVSSIAAFLLPAIGVGVSLQGRLAWRRGGPWFVQ